MLTGQEKTVFLFAGLLCVFLFFLVESFPMSSQLHLELYGTKSANEFALDDPNDPRIGHVPRSNAMPSVSRKLRLRSVNTRKEDQ